MELDKLVDRERALLAQVLDKAIPLIETLVHNSREDAASVVQLCRYITSELYGKKGVDILSLQRRISKLDPLVQQEVLPILEQIKEVEANVETEG